MAIRVFQLAKELNVTSKQVLHKCRAEGLELKNHMAALSAGLEATIREWFSEEASHTAVEVSESVDLDMAHKLREQEDRRRGRTPEEEAAEAKAAADKQAAEAAASEQPGQGEAADSAADGSDSDSAAADATADAAGETETQAPVAESGEAAADKQTADAGAAAAESAAADEPAAESQPQAQTNSLPPLSPFASVAPAATAPVSKAVDEASAASETPAKTEAEKVDTADKAAAEEPAAAVADKKVDKAAAEAAKDAGDKDKKPAPAADAPVLNEPEAPDDVAPAGPQLVPKPAQLQGPKVIRVEQPDYMPAPRRRQRDDNRDEGFTGAAAAAAGGSGVAPRRGAKPGPAGPAGPGGPGGDAAARKRRRNSPRRKGRTGDTDRIREWRDRDLSERRERLAAAGAGMRRHRSGGPNNAASNRPDGPVEVEEPITLKSLSAATGIKSAEFIKKLMGMGVFATVNQTVSCEQAETLAADYGIELKIKRRLTSKDKLDERFSEATKSEGTDSRPPVVTFLGHVDHGKTSLLDYIRQASVVDTESGGITQHIGSYRYEKDGHVVTFLDTPGHEAFTHMRARGANMTDIVVLVVAADDGVMPQTIEAINHAKAADVPIVVALNKIDVPNANPTRVLGQLAEHGLQPQEWGGKTEVVQTSAIKGDGMNELVELLALEAELLELKADPSADATGVVIEAEMDPGRGNVARLLVQDGTLEVGDVIVAGNSYGRVRQILNDRGRDIQSAGPSTPIEVAGLDGAPAAGDKFYQAKDISEAKNIAEEIREEQRELSLASKSQITLDNLFSHISAGDVSELPLIVKADVQGSVEVLSESLNKLSTEQVRVKILHAAVGGVSNSDVLLAEASGAIIVGFHVIADASVREQADRLGVDIRLYRIIYELIDEVTQAMSGLLEPEKKEDILGHAEVRDVFKVTRVGAIAGCYVTDGTIARNAFVRVTRDGIVIEEDRLLASLKRFKDDVRDVRASMECGMRIEGYDDIKVGDVLEAYKIIEVAREL